jgi:plasmid maintenance system antidote protein VapI
MVHVAQRNSDRCPTHPGALLREDVIPATGRTKAEIAQLLRISR